MKTKKKRNINKYFVGGTINDILGQSDSIALLLGTLPLQSSSAANKGVSVNQSIQDIFSGASAGAKLGSVIPGVGTALGAGIGTATGLVGKSGNVQSNGFYEDPTLNLGTGLIGAFKNKGLRRKYEDEKRRVAGNRYSLSNTQQLQSDWSEDYDNNIYTMAKGGQIPSSLAYVDDGELITTPLGDLLEVPENGNPTDSNLVNLPEGSRILSDTLKVPGTKKTFAQIGKDMMSKKRSKNKDQYAENSAKLNKMNDKIIHDKLFNVLESIKIKKNNSNKFVKGGTNMLPEVVITANKPRRFDNSVMPSIQGINWGDYTIPNTPISNATRDKMVKGYNTVNYQEPESESYDWLGTLGKVGSAIGKLSPVLSNLGSSSETFSTVENPYSGSIMENVSGRRYNIDPAIRAIRDNVSVSNYNADRINPSTGANMAYRLQSAIATDKAISDLYSQKSNIDNQYKGDYANILNALGQQNVAARNLSIDQNARSRAASRNINRAGWSQFSNYLQNEELMGNQMAMDRAMLDLYKPFLEAGYKTSDIANFMNKYRNR